MSSGGSTSTAGFSSAYSSRARTSSGGSDLSGVATDVSIKSGGGGGNDLGEGVTGDGIDPGLLEKRFEGLRDTQESVQGLSLWCQANKRHATAIIDIWLKTLRRSPVEKRLTMFYLANDIVQHAKRKGDSTLVNQWAVAVQKATPHVRSPSSVSTAIARIFKIWEERNVYSRDAVADLMSLLSKHNVPGKDKNEKPVKKKPETYTASAEKVQAFQPSALISKIKSAFRHKSHLGVTFRSKQYVNMNMEQLISSIKDRQHGMEVVEEMSSLLEQLKASEVKLLSEVEERQKVVDTAEVAIVHYENVRVEARIVNTAYKSFTTRVMSTKESVDKKMSEFNEMESPPRSGSPPSSIYTESRKSKPGQPSNIIPHDVIHGKAMTALLDTMSRPQSSPHLPPPEVPHHQYDNSPSKVRGNNLESPTTPNPVQNSDNGQASQGQGIPYESGNFGYDLSSWTTENYNMMSNILQMQQQYAQSGLPYQDNNHYNYNNMTPGQVQGYVPSPSFPPPPMTMTQPQTPPSLMGINLAQPPPIPINPSCPPPSFHQQQQQEEDVGSIPLPPGPGGGNIPSPTGGLHQFDPGPPPGGGQGMGHYGPYYPQPQPPSPDPSPSPSSLMESPSSGHYEYSSPPPGRTRGGANSFSSSGPRFHPYSTPAGTRPRPRGPYNNHNRDSSSNPNMVPLGPRPGGILGKGPRPSFGGMQSSQSPGKPRFPQPSTPGSGYSSGPGPSPTGSTGSGESPSPNQSYGGGNPNQNFAQISGSSPGYPGYTTFSPESDGGGINGGVGVDQVAEYDEYGSTGGDSDQMPYESSGPGGSYGGMGMSGGTPQKPRPPFQGEGRPRARGFNPVRYRGSGGGGGGGPRFRGGGDRGYRPRGRGPARGVGRGGPPPRGSYPRFIR